ncbi:GNAT family N-acetyltransferase [Micromonospora chersina]|uniref:GNAT family N-acetyltransferase n=2 Tax=Micromonospora chersina TaxID=47854 RepID=UPI0033E2ACB7
MMTVQRLPAPVGDAEKLVAILHEADEDDERIRAALRDPACRTYLALEDDTPVGAAVVRWDDEQSSEILYIAVVADRRGAGLGRQIVAAIQADLPAHGRTLVVGTANSAIDNIAFYQKCGFRMHSVRRDYFDYIQPPVEEHGIVMRDMLLFTYDVPPTPDRSS